MFEEIDSMVAVIDDGHGEVPGGSLVREGACQSGSTPSKQDIPHSIQVARIDFNYQVPYLFCFEGLC